MTKLFRNLVCSCFILLSLFLLPSETKACDRSSLELDSVVQVGSEFDIYVTLNIGAGIFGSMQGADNGTTQFGFGFYSTTVNPINFSFFTPSVISDTTAELASAIPIGTPPLGTQGFILYQPTNGLFTCTNSNAVCGFPHTQSDQYRFRTNILPDSIRAFGVEGMGNPMGGCIDQDMLICLAGCFTPSSITIQCPPNQQLTNCVLDDYTGLATVTDTTDPNPTVTQTPPAGTSPFGSTTQVTLFATNNSLQSSSCTFLVTNNNQPLAGTVAVDTLSNGENILCPGGIAGLATVTASGGCGSYTYLWSNGATSDTTSGYLAGFHSVTITDSAGGTRVVSFQVTEPPALQASIPSNLSVCGNNTANFTVGLSGGNGGLQFCVIPTGTTTEFCFQGTGGNAVVTGLGAGSYTGITRDSLGCEQVDTFSIAQTPTPNIDLGSDTTLCQGQNIILDPGVFAASYNWSTGATFQSISVTNSGSYSVTVIGFNGCQASDTIMVTFQPTVSVNLGPDTTYCLGQTANLDAGNPGSSYLWSTGATSQTINATATGLFSVIVDDGNGCPGSDSIQLLFAPNPVVNLGPDLTICDGDSVLLSAGNLGSSFIWNTNETTQMIVANTSGVYSVTVSDGNTCMATDSMNLTVSPNPMVALGSDTMVCPGETVTFDAGNSGSTYLWNTGAVSQTLTTNTPGTYAVAVTNADGCTGTDSVQLSNFAAPNVNLGSAQSICMGGSTLLDAGNPGSGYLWSTGATSQTISVSMAGVYSVTVTNGNGCTGVDAVTVTVEPDPIVNLGADTTLCNGNGITLNAGNPGATYLWSTGDNTGALPLTMAGTYSVTVTSSAGCTGSDTIVVSTGTNPFAAYNQIAATGNQSFDFLDQSTGSVSSWLWDFGDGVTSNMQNPNHTYASPGTYTVCLTVTGPCGSGTTCLPTTVTQLETSPTTNGLIVFPNPSSGRLQVKFDQAQLHDTPVEIIDLRGKTLFQAIMQAGTAQVELDLEALPAGMYFLRSGQAVKRFKIQR